MTNSLEARPEDESEQSHAAETPNYSYSAQATGETSGMSIVGFILSFLFPLLGLVLSIVAWKNAGKTGDKTGLAKAGIIIGTVLSLAIVGSMIVVGILSAEIASQGLETSELISTAPAE